MNPANGGSPTLFLRKRDNTVLINTYNYSRIWKKLKTLY